MGAPASAETSGTSRHWPFGEPHEPFAPLATPRLDAAWDWKAGIGHNVEMPPPPAPGLELLVVVFHTTSLLGVPSWSVVPPTPITYGWLAGSSTWRLSAAAPFSWP